MDFRLCVNLTLLFAILFGSSPVSAYIISDEGDRSQPPLEQPFEESEEEKEESKSELEELKLVDSGVVSLPSFTLPNSVSGRDDNPIHLSQPVLTGPDHSRAPPASHSC